MTLLPYHGSDIVDVAKLDDGTYVFIQTDDFTASLTQTDSLGRDATVMSFTICSNPAKAWEAARELENLDD